MFDNPFVQFQSFAFMDFVILVLFVKVTKNSIIKCGKLDSKKVHLPCFLFNTFYVSKKNKVHNKPKVAKHIQ